MPNVSPGGRLTKSATEYDALVLELQRSNADLDRFAHVAAHELSEPLRGVAGLVTLLSRKYEGQLDDTGDELIQRTVAATERMRTLIDDMLAFSELGDHTTQCVATDCGELVSRAVDGVAVSLAEAGGEIEVGALPTIVADPTLMTQVMQNLLANAIKFRSEDPLRVGVSADPDDDGWRFAVSDNGIGVDPRYRERIFTSFTRLHGRDAYPGTGLGLSICRRSVERMGGRIWIQGGAAEGSTFVFTLPDRSPT